VGTPKSDVTFSSEQVLLNGLHTYFDKNGESVISFHYPSISCTVRGKDGENVAWISFDIFSRR